jgi:hypothetical protein
VNVGVASKNLPQPWNLDGIGGSGNLARWRTDSAECGAQATPAGHKRTRHTTGQHDHSDEISGPQLHETF